MPPLQCNILFLFIYFCRSDGISGLYRGFGISCVGIFIYRGLYFGLYDSLKPILLRENHQSFSSAFFLGWFVTAISGIIDYPLDTTRRRMMMTSGESIKKYRNSIECALDIKRREGYNGFFKGVNANILRGVAGAIVLAGSDKLKEIYIQYKINW